MIRIELRESIGIPEGSRAARFIVIVSFAAGDRIHFRSASRRMACAAIADLRSEHGRDATVIGVTEAEIQDGAAWSDRILRTEFGVDAKGRTFH